MKIFNRRARYEYELSDRVEAGIALSGAEVKSIKNGRGDIGSAFVRIKDSEAFLVGANIPLYQGASARDYDPIRTRKLLLHKKELVSLQTRVRQKNLTLVPICLYTKGHLVKLEVALGRGKRQFEKREVIKRQDIEREVARELKER